MGEDRLDCVGASGAGEEVCRQGRGLDPLGDKGERLDQESTGRCYNLC